MTINLVMKLLLAICKCLFDCEDECVIHAFEDDAGNKKLLQLMEFQDLLCYIMNFSTLYLTSHVMCSYLKGLIPSFPSRVHIARLATRILIYVEEMLHDIVS